MPPIISPHSHRVSLLDKTLGEEGLCVVFQPIMQLGTMSITAHEGLSRPADPSSGLDVQDLLNLARACGRQSDFESAAARNACAAFVQQKGTGGLLVNFSTRTLLHKSLRPNLLIDALSETGIQLDRLTLEITEQDVVDNLSDLARALEDIRAQGVHISLDDFGDGYHNFKIWNELRPEMVKIDRYLIHGIARSSERLAIVRALCTVADTIGTHLVAEGVERAEDLQLLRELGIPYAQGYLFGYPQPNLTEQNAVRMGIQRYL